MCLLLFYILTYNILLNPWNNCEVDAIIILPLQLRKLRATGHMTP